MPCAVPAHQPTEGTAVPSLGFGDSNWMPLGLNCMGLGLSVACAAAGRWSSGGVAETMDCPLMWTGWGGGGGGRSEAKRVCVPKIGLRFRGPFMEFFFLRKVVLMWGAGRPLLKQGGGGAQGAPGAVTMEVAGDSQSGWGQLLAVGGAVAGGWGASKGTRQGVV